MNMIIPAVCRLRSFCWLSESRCLRSGFLNVSRRSQEFFVRIISALVWQILEFALETVEFVLQCGWRWTSRHCWCDITNWWQFSGVHARRWSDVANWWSSVDDIWRWNGLEGNRQLARMLKMNSKFLRNVWKRDMEDHRDHRRCRSCILLMDARKKQPWWRLDQSEIAQKAFNRLAYSWISLIRWKNSNLLNRWRLKVNQVMSANRLISDGSADLQMTCVSLLRTYKLL